MKRCDCYNARVETIESKYGSFIDAYGVCLGAKEQNRCNCYGDESKCDFYPEKRKAAEKKMNTAEMWLKAQEDGKTYIVKQQTLCYSKQRGLFYATNCHSNFNNFTLDKFLSLEWTEMQEEIMTKAEAEKKFGIRIVD